MLSSRFITRHWFATGAALVFGFALLATPPARAENPQGTTKVRKQTTTITVKESEGDTADDKPVSTGPVTEEVEKVKTATFGSRSQTGMAGCKTEEALQASIKDLKADCGAWVKDQKSELKARFLTSSCEELCEDCGMSLRRCTVLGTISYIIKVTRPQ